MAWSPSNLGLQDSRLGEGQGLPDASFVPSYPVVALQCYTCHEPTGVSSCVTIATCNANETMCKTILYSLETGQRGLGGWGDHPLPPGDRAAGAGWAGGQVSGCWVGGAIDRSAGAGWGGARVPGSERPPGPSPLASYAQCASTALAFCKRVFGPSN